MAEVRTSYGDMTLNTATTSFRGELSEADKRMVLHLAERVNDVRVAHQRFIQVCDRMDSLYYAETFTRGGADLWADDPNAEVPGRSHVSVNTPAAYVDVPAALQAVPPVENMLPTENTKEARDSAAMLERAYVAWKRDQFYDLQTSKACTVKGLYGRTFGKVYWDREDKKLCFELVDQPRNLYVGYKSDRYEQVEWAAYVQRMDPNSVAEEFGVDVKVAIADDQKTIVPFFQEREPSVTRTWLDWGPSQVEVWDYWYRKPADRQRRDGGVRMETWNMVVAGNMVVRGPVKYTEYKGKIPYLPLFNTFIPGVPDGRPDLYDVEPLIREKYEMITAGSQMIAAGVAGDFWQLTGPEAPPKGDLKIERNKVNYPGAGNRIEPITPFIAQFQLEQHLGRIDREMAVITGLNDLLLSLAPVQALNSSKALNALISQFETRISIRRQLLYAWRRKVWEMGVEIWAQKDKTIRSVIEAGGGSLDIADPSLSPRDEFETAQRAASLVNAKLWSQRRGMDAVHVDDPESEQDMIREERTDATMFPADVQVMAQLMAALQSLGLQTPPAAQGQAQAQLASGQNDLRTALGGAAPGQTTSTQGEGEVPLPPEALSAGATPPGGVPAPFAQGPTTPGGQGPVGTAQTMIQEGKAKSRILTQQQLGRR